MYCAVAYNWDGGAVWQVKEYSVYEDVGKYCYYNPPHVGPTECFTADVGDPRLQ